MAQPYLPVTDGPINKTVGHMEALFVISPRLFGLYSVIQYASEENPSDSDRNGFVVLSISQYKEEKNGGGGETEAIWLHLGSTGCSSALRNHHEA